MKTLRVYFLDWYDWILPGSSSDNIFLWILKKHYNVVIDPVNPEVLFYSLFFNKHLEYKNCLKIYVNSEPLAYNNLEIYDKNLRHVVSINDADHIITSYKSNIQKNFYMPIFLMWLYHHIYVTKVIESFESLLESRTPNEKKDFCVYLHNNNVPVKRKSIFGKLSDYKYIHTKSDLGIPDGSLNKINSIKDFKFSFAMQNHHYSENFENYDVPGLIDEKIIESLIANTIPIYYGNELVDEYLNEKSFLNYHNFKTEEEFIDAIIKIDRSPILTNQMLSEPIITNIENLKLKELEEHIISIINNL